MGSPKQKRKRKCRDILRKIKRKTSLFKSKKEEVEAQPK